jgi:hypothetical protein
MSSKLKATRKLDTFGLLLLLAFGALAGGRDAPRSISDGSTAHGIWSFGWSYAPPSL